MVEIQTDIEHLELEQDETDRYVKKLEKGNENITKRGASSEMDIPIDDLKEYRDLVLDFLQMRRDYYRDEGNLEKAQEIEIARHKFIEEQGLTESDFKDNVDKQLWREELMSFFERKLEIGYWLQQEVEDSLLSYQV